MNHTPKSVLIVNFDFPPNQGIGGRRWAKLAKGLANRGVNVFVVKANPVPENETSAWSADVELSGIEIHSLPRWYPVNVSHPRKTLLGKFRYRMDLHGVRRRERGTIYDVAIGWYEVLARKVANLVQRHNIKILIGTGAPFNVLYYCALIKRSIPGLFFLADYRDPWIAARNYGMPFLTQKRLTEEKRKQDLVFSEANVITSPYQELTDQLFRESQLSNVEAKRFKVLPHFYDPDDIPVQLNTRPKSQEKIVFVYGGAIYLETEKLIQQWLEFLAHCRAHNRQFYNRMEFRIYTDNLKEAAAFSDYEAVKVHGTIGKKIFDEISAADFCIVLAADHNRNQLTTKFFEYLPLRKPYIYLGPEGDLSRFIVSNRLGLRIDDFHKDMPALVHAFDTKGISFDSNFDFTDFALPKATDYLLGLMQ